MEHEESLDEIFNLNPTLPNFNNNITCNYSYQPQEIATTKNPNVTPHQVSHPRLLSFGRSTNTPFDAGGPSHEAANDLNQSSQIISFSPDNDPRNHNIHQSDQYENGANHGNSPKRVFRINSIENPLQVERILAERRRRERQSQLFVSLSEVVPAGVKKVDKVTLLEDAIKHLKDLEERVEELEELEELNKRYNDALKFNDDCMPEDDQCVAKNDSFSSEIKVKFSNKFVLIQILCKKREGLMSIVPLEMEKMKLSVLDMRFMPFGGSALCVIILAEMKSEFHGTVKDVVDQLQIIFFNPREKCNRRI